MFTDLTSPSYERYLAESSLSRVWRHAQPDRSFFVLTAYRAVYTTEQNQQRNEELKGDLRARGFGFFEVEGHYIEDQQPVKEVSLFVPTGERDPEQVRRAAFELGVRYEQHSVLLKPQGSDQARLVNTWYGKSKDDRPGQDILLGQYRPNRLSSYMTRLKGDRSFTFESVVQPRSQQERAIFEHLGQLW